MTLDPQSHFPSTRCYVLKLHREASPQRLCGRLEHVDSGAVFAFAAPDQLVELLRRHCAQLQQEPGNAGAQR